MENKWNDAKPITKEQFNDVLKMIEALQKRSSELPPWTFEDLQRAKDAELARREAGLPIRTAFDLIKGK